MLQIAFVSVYEYIVTHWARKQKQEKQKKANFSKNQVVRVSWVVPLEVLLIWYLYCRGFAQLELFFLLLEERGRLSFQIIFFKSYCNTPRPWGQQAKFIEDCQLFPPKDKFQYSKEKVANFLDTMSQGIYILMLVIFLFR